VSTWLCHIIIVQGASCTYLAHLELESILVIIIIAHQVERHTLMIPSAVQSDEQHVNLVLGHSYIHTDGKLTGVPASRGAVFRDRTLGPMDKRLLTRFLMQLGNSMQDNPFPQVLHRCKYKLAVPSYMIAHVAIHALCNICMSYCYGAVTHLTTGRPTH